MKLLRLGCAAVTAALLATACGGGNSGSSGSSGCNVKAPSGLLHSGQLTFGSDISYPPQEYMVNTKPTGFDIDIGTAIAQKMCLQAQFINQSFDSIIPALDARKFDAIISAMTDNATREQKVNFVRYFNAGEALLGKKDSGLKINALTDLCGHKVATEAGTAEADEVKTVNCPGGGTVAATTTTYQTDTEALEQLRKGTVELEFTDSPVAEYDAKKNPDFKIVSPVLEVAPEGIAVRKDDPIGSAIKQAFSAIEQDGTYDSILSKWGLKDGDIRKASSS